MEYNMSSNFIHEIIDQDNASGLYGKRVHTRFPPEPNGYLHIGHAKSLCLNFGTALKYGGKCNLRFDDTNPIKEDTEYVDSIEEDVKWLGFTWEGEPRFASDYFDTMYQCALKLIKKGKAFVCDLNAEEIRKYRGTLTEPGKNSPYRDRSIEENLALFERMKEGEFADGEKVLRAKIDMASPNINMRDPIIYRIAHAEHHNTGSKWCIYPMYDFAHPIEDAVEGITHSICTLEFEDHRPLYDWVLRECEFDNPPKQIEFARLTLTNNVMSKRKLKKLVDENYVDGWDDPRMPTISGLRRRGYTPESIRDFCDKIGVSKAQSVVDYALLEYCIREDLKMKVPRPMAAIDPIKVIITNWEPGKSETIILENNQEDESMGTREVTFSGEVYIDGADFMENPPKKYFRLYPGNEVRLKGAYIIQCVDFKKNETTGKIEEIYCTYDPDTKSGEAKSDRKVKGTIHWVNCKEAIAAKVNLYEHLFLDEPSENATEVDGMFLNQNSLTQVDAFIEPFVLENGKYTTFQFMRNGYFALDKKKSGSVPVFNRVVSLKSSFKLK